MTIIWQMTSYWYSLVSVGECCCILNNIALEYVPNRPNDNKPTLGKRQPRGRLDIKMSSYQYKHPMLRMRRSRDRLIFNMGIPIPGKDGLCIDTGPWQLAIIPTSDDPSPSRINASPGLDVFLICHIRWRPYHCAPLTHTWHRFYKVARRRFSCGT